MAACRYRIKLMMIRSVQIGLNSVGRSHRKTICQRNFFECCFVFSASCQTYASMFSWTTRPIDPQSAIAAGAAFSSAACMKS